MPIKPPKNILITHVYSSDNKGDAALTSVLISDLRRKFPGAKLTILKLDKLRKNARFEGVLERPSFMYFVANAYKTPLSKIAYVLFMMPATLLAAGIVRLTGRHMYLPPHLRETLLCYQQSDLIVPVGGGYIRSRTGLVNRWNIPLLLHPLLLGYILGKPTVLYAQSMGPFHGALEKKITQFVLRRMTLILLREDTSVALLKSIGVSANVSRAIDSGFLLRSSGSVDVRSLYDIPQNKLLIGVTVRSWLHGEAQVNYEKAVAGALDELVNGYNAHALFIPQVTATKGDDDRLASRRVRGFMQHKEQATVVEDAPDHHRIKAMYDNLDILLGTRFHSVIFSLTSHVPVVAIEYEHKTSGIMRDLKLEGWVIKIEEVTAQNLTAKLCELVAEQQEYRRYLRKCMPPYVQKAAQTIDMVEQALFLQKNKQNMGE